MRPYGWLTDPSIHQSIHDNEDKQALRLMRCQAVWHCSENDKWLDKCDHIKLNLANLVVVQIIVASRGRARTLVDCAR